MLIDPNKSITNVVKKILKIIVLLDKYTRRNK